MKRTIAAAFALATLATGCGLGVPADGAAGPDEPVAGDTRPSDEQLRADAQALLGTAEGELGDRARVGRRGDEQMVLTEDYVVGRFTVELDDDGSGTYRVTVVTVEMEAGPETFRA